MKIKEHRAQSTPVTVKDSGTGVSDRGLEYTTVKKKMGQKPKTKMYAQTGDMFELYDRNEGLKKKQRRYI